MYAICVQSNLNWPFSPHVLRYPKQSPSPLTSRLGHLYPQISIPMENTSPIHFCKPRPTYSCSKTYFMAHIGNLPSPWQPPGSEEFIEPCTQFFLAREVLFLLQSFKHPQIPQSWDSMSPSLLPHTLMPAWTWLYSLALPHSWHQVSQHLVVTRKTLSSLFLDSSLPLGQRFPENPERSHGSR